MPHQTDREQLTALTLFLVAVIAFALAFTVYVANQ